MRSLATTFFALLVAMAGFGQTIGNFTLSRNSSVLNNPKPFTVIDLNSPATADGNIGAVTFKWQGNCPGAAKVKFLRRTGSTYTITAERGPFDTNFSTTVILTPPVPVLQGDLIGITALTPCGGPLGFVPILDEAAVQIAGDTTGSVSTSSGDTLLHFALALFGAQSADSEVRTQIIPVAGATQGAGGAQFKTDVFLFCLRGPRCAGRLVYHAATTTGAPTDVSAAFDIAEEESKTFLDLVGTTLNRTGTGSIDVYVRMTGGAPNVSARIYDDAGAAGTKGFTFDALTPSEAIPPFNLGVIFTPASNQFRMNLGVRTLDEPVTVQYEVFASNGLRRAVVTRNYPANYFIQVPVSEAVGVATLPGDTILAFAANGSIFVYGSIIDNTTNDPSVQVAKLLK